MYKPAVALAVLVALAALPASAAPRANKLDHQIRITFVNVGAGLCTVIECPGKPATTSPILYDCGAKGRGNSGLARGEAVKFVNEILDRYGVGPRVVVSHPDGDHYNYINDIDFTGKKKPQAIWLGLAANDYSSIFQGWLDTQKKAGVTIHTYAKEWFNNNDPIAGLMCGTATYLLMVNAGDTKNDSSMVLRIQFDKFSATMTGDATSKTLDSIIKNYNIKWLATTLLSAPHHGADSEGSNGTKWSKAFLPAIVVYSAGTRFLHPRCNSVSKYDLGKTLRLAQNHPLQCGDDGAYFLHHPYTNAQYLTQSDGNIAVQSDGKWTQVFCDAVGVKCDLN
jgi:competence protein ComEC